MATVEIDQDLCIADQVCASMHPDLYEMGDDGFAHVVEGKAEIEGEEVDRALEGAEACPVDAITVEE